MKKRWFAGMAFLMAILLSACGKNADAAGKGTTEPETAVGTTTEISESTVPPQETDVAVETTEGQVPEAYAVAVVVTINPQVKLYLDADNVIVGVEYLNEDAKTAFSDIDFSNVTVEEGMEKIIAAAVEKEFLTDGKDVSIDVAEVKDTTCDTAVICEKVETAAVKAAEENHVAAVVTAQVSAEPSEPDETGNASDETAGSTTEETKQESAKPAAEEKPSEEPGTASDTEPETEPAQEQPAEPVASNPCSNCGGTGKCDECKGDGCRGAGYTVSCPRCHGSLTETCIYCDANGNSLKHDGACDFPNCMGAHVYPCTTCGGGTRPVVCASCNGSGKCKVCGGSGTK